MEQKIKRERGADTLTTLGDVFEGLAAKDGLFQNSFSFNNKIIVNIDEINIEVSYKDGFDVKGSDYDHYKTDFDQCIRDCYKDIKCASWTYVQGECWKKGGIPSPVESNGAKTGWFVEKFKCKNIK
eukprot:NODE_295_length_11479_cov_0.183480.p9 type:complete len:126 gc:universal NODE_295_length_11479_cov_0.183480:9812-9435(-)